MIEHERSYVMTVEDGRKFLDMARKNSGLQALSLHIEDYYFDKEMRLRFSGSNCCLTLKKGDKADGFRFEREEPIDFCAAEILKEKAVLVIKKDRHKIDLKPDDTGKSPRYLATMDFITSPMRLAVLEVEADDEGLYPVPADIAEKLFGIPLRECPLSSWCLFNRKIGICGGPSSGKSETAKWLSHSINTRFNGNSFNVVEFATSFIQKYKHNPTFYDQFFIWYGQRARESDAHNSNLVISDCPTFLSFIYMTLLNKLKFSKDTAMYLSKIYKRVLFDLTHYTDMIFMQLQTYTENNVRYNTPEEAMEIQERIARFLDDHNIPHVKATYNDGEQILSDLFYINRLGSV